MSEQPSSRDLLASSPAAEAAVAEAKAPNPPAVAAAAPAAAAPSAVQAVAVPRHLLSRLLYPNPVCALTVRDAGDTGRRNVMIISWLTAIDNHGRFVCSLNEGRHTARFIEEEEAHFVLNPITLGMQELATAVGGCSGAEVDKFARFSLRACRPGWAPEEGEEEEKEEEEEGREAKAAPPRRKKKQQLSQKAQRAAAVQAAARTTVALVDGVAAHLLCSVQSIQRSPGHLICSCEIIAAWCRPEYWSGRSFGSQAPDVPPLLSFLGSGEFAVMTPLLVVAGAAAGGGDGAALAVAPGAAPAAHEQPSSRVLDLQLWKAVEARCGAARVTELVGRGADVNWPNPDRRDETALIVACQKGDTDAVAALLSAGADANARNRYGVTALTCAAYNGHAPVVASLLSVPGLDVSARDDDGTALDQAQGDEVRALLLEAADKFCKA